MGCLLVVWSDFLWEKLRWPWSPRFINGWFDIFSPCILLGQNPWFCFLWFQNTPKPKKGTVQPAYPWRVLLGHAAMQPCNSGANHINNHHYIITILVDIEFYWPSWNPLGFFQCLGRAQNVSIIFCVFFSKKSPAKLQFMRWWSQRGKGMEGRCEGNLAISLTDFVRVEIWRKIQVLNQ